MKTEMLLQPTLPTELFLPPVPGGVLPYISFLGSRTNVYDFDHSGLKSGMIFKETMTSFRHYLSFQLQMNNREREVTKIYHSS